MIGPSLARKSSKRNWFQPTSRIHSGPWNIDAIRNTFDGSRIKTKRGPEILKHTCSKFKQNNSAQPNDLWIENNPGIEGPPEFDHAHWENTFTKNCGCHKKLWMFYDCGFFYWHWCSQIPGHRKWRHSDPDQTPDQNKNCFDCWNPAPFGMRQGPLWLVVKNLVLTSAKFWQSTIVSSECICNHDPRHVFHNLQISEVGVRLRTLLAMISEFSHDQCRWHQWSRRRTWHTRAEISCSL